MREVLGVDRMDGESKGMSGRARGDGRGGLTGTARAEMLDDNPAAASRGPGQITVFLRGADGTLQVSELSNGAFTP